MLQFCSLLIHILSRFPTEYVFLLAPSLVETLRHSLSLSIFRKHSLTQPLSHQLFIFYFYYNEHACIRSTISNEDHEIIIPAVTNMLDKDMVKPIKDVFCIITLIYAIFACIYFCCRLGKTV